MMMMMRTSLYSSEYKCFKRWMEKTVDRVATVHTLVDRTRRGCANLPTVHALQCATGLLTSSMPEPVNKHTPPWVSQLGQLSLPSSERCRNPETRAWSFTAVAWRPALADSPTAGEVQACRDCLSVSSVPSSKVPRRLLRASLRGFRPSISNTHCTYPQRDGQPEWAWMAWINTGVVHPLKMVTNPSTNQARRSLTLSMWPTPLPPPYPRTL